MVLYEPRTAAATRSLDHLSKEDVAALLKSIDLSAHAGAFLATPITGADLKLMEEADLVSLGVGMSSTGGSCCGRSRTGRATAACRSTPSSTRRRTRTATGACGRRRRRSASTRRS